MWDRWRVRRWPGWGPLAPTDLSAIAGGVVWLALTAAGTFGQVRSLVALAMLVLVPLALRLVDDPAPDGSRSVVYALGVAAQAPAALAAVAAMTLDPGPLAAALAVPYLGMASMVALVGLERFLERRRLPPLSELAVDAGLAYLPVAGAALIADRLGLALGFQPLIVTLTVIHFHYAGFVLPLVTGLAGRRRPAGRAGAMLDSVTAIIVVGPGIIAVGITFFPLVELLAVGFFTAAVSLLALLVVLWVVPALHSRPQQVLIAVAFVGMPVSMAYAVGYGYSAFAGVGYVTIAEMIDLHGTVNAFGFALPVLLGWRLDVPDCGTAD